MAVVQLGGCGFSVGTGNGTGAQSDLAETSTLGIPPADSHTHTFTIPGEDLDSPPTENKTYTSDNVEGHTHQITLAPGDFDTLLSGEVKNASSTSAGAPAHYHNVNFQIEDA